MDKTNILGISVVGRNEVSTEIQSILTKHGCVIKARLGLPQQEINACTNKGIIILQLSGDSHEIDAVKQELNQLDGVNADFMSI